jgi:two-component system LytT family response regulator
VTTFQVLVAEDEPLARRMVVDLVKRDGDVAAVVACANADEVRAALSQRSFDIAFLDIEMPGATGVELAAALQSDGPVVVFVTAFSQYAPDAFGVSAVDYVLKPFADERFFAALERAKRRVRERRLGDLAGQMAKVSAEITHRDDTPASSYLNWLPCPQGERSVLVATSDIVWIQAEDYYVLVHAKKGRYMIRTTLASLAERLNPQIFLRVHRTAIVNAHEVTEVRDKDRVTLVLSNGAQVPVSRSRRGEVEWVKLAQLRRLKTARS